LQLGAIARRNPRQPPYRRGEDISYAIDALGTIPGIDPERIGVLGICAGGGYAVHTARTDHRIKAVATVFPGNIGTSFTATPPVFVICRTRCDSGPCRQLTEK
jgi:dienelactone hydrolase